MKAFLDTFLPRFFPNLDFQCIPHEGKSDLEKSIPRKLRGYRTPGVQFLILRDNDGKDCVDLKRRLVKLCEEHERPDTVVRIVCQELEAWYLSDPTGLAVAYSSPDLEKIKDKTKFRNPDAIVKPSLEMERLIPHFQKIAGAERMAKHLCAMRARKRSKSFAVFLRSIEHLIHPPPFQTSIDL